MALWCLFNNMGHQVPRTVGKRDVELNRAWSLLFRGSQESIVNNAVTKEQ